MLNNKTSGFISILFVMLIWGSAFAVTKLAVKEVPPFLFAFLRNLIACLFLLPFYLIKRQRRQHQLRQISRKKIILMGLTGITFFYTFFNLSLVYTTATTGALIQGLMPVAIALPAVLFLKEKLSGRGILGIALSVMGVAFVGFIGVNAESENNLTGNVLMILSVICWAAYTVIAKSDNQNDPILITALTTFIGTFFLLPTLVIELWNDKIPAITGQGWAAITYLGVFSSALCYILYNKALKTLPAALVGNFLNLDPIIGAAIAILFLKDKITGWQIAGAALVLAGIWLSSKPIKTRNG